MSTTWDVVVSAFGARPETDEILKSVAVLLHPDWPHELRGLPSGRSRLVRANDPDRLISAVEELADDRGVYYTLNPVRHDLGDRAARVTDVTQRYNLLIDVDPVKAVVDAMATDAEKDAAVALASSVLDHLCKLGWPAPVMIDSGNGSHLIYRIDLPANDHTRVIIGRVLKALADKLNTPEAKIDTKVHNASRISKLPGTWVRKGPSTDDRPHRMAHLIWAPDRVECVSLDQLEAVAGVEVTAEPVKRADGWSDVTVNGEGGLTTYVRRAIEGECGKLNLATERNNALNAAAFALGQFALWPEMQVDEAKEALRRTAELIGLAADPGCGPKGIDATIRSGWESGAKEPRPRPVEHKNGKHAQAKPLRALTVRGHEIKPEKVDWLWRDRVAIDFITIFAGRTGIGKSFVAMDLAARLTTGKTLPDGSLPGGPANVLVISEDPLSQMLVPRLIELGANMTRVAFMTFEAMTRYTLDKTDMLSQASEEAEYPRLIVIDPPTNFLGEVDEHKNAEVRAVLMRLVDWIQGKGVALILITHINKQIGKGIEAIYRVMGSVAWVSTSRVAMAFTADPKDRTRCLFVGLKNNLGPMAKTMIYQISSTDSLAAVTWHGFSEVDADEAMTSTPAKRVSENVLSWLEKRFREKRVWLSKELTDLWIKQEGGSHNALHKDLTRDLYDGKFQKTNKVPGSADWHWVACFGWPPESPPESPPSSHPGEKGGVSAPFESRAESPESPESPYLSPCNKRTDQLSGGGV